MNAEQIAAEATNDIIKNATGLLMALLCSMTVRSDADGDTLVATIEEEGELFYRNLYGSAKEEELEKVFFHLIHTSDDAAGKRLRDAVPDVVGILRDKAMDEDSQVLYSFIAGWMAFAHNFAALTSGMMHDAKDMEKILAKGQGGIFFQ